MQKRWNKHIALLASLHTLCYFSLSPRLASFAFVNHSKLVISGQSGALIKYSKTHI